MISSWSPLQFCLLLNPTVILTQLTSQLRNLQWSLQLKSCQMKLQGLPWPSLHLKPGI